MMKLLILFWLLFQASFSNLFFDQEMQFYNFKPLLLIFYLVFLAYLDLLFFHRIDLHALGLLFLIIKIIKLILTTNY